MLSPLAEISAASTFEQKLEKNQSLLGIESLQPQPENVLQSLVQDNVAQKDQQKLKDLDIIRDPLDKLSAEFKVPEKLEIRVRFWFDVYTKYGKRVHILHHSLYPWIVFQIIDLTEPIDQGQGPEWLRVERAEKQVRLAKIRIEKSLKRLSRHPRQPKNDLERELIVRLKEVPGSRRKVYREAAQSLRSQLGQKDFFEEGLQRSSKYLPYLEETFRQSNLPEELTRLPFVESSFNEKAQSKVGASGIWQVMPATGRAYGLVSPSIDERNSPIKASKMAAHLLRSYYRALKSWPLTITAYNHGFGNIQKAIKAAKSRDLPTIIERYHQGDFLFASANFYACFLAALHAERYSENLFPTALRDPILVHESYKITRKTPLLEVLKVVGLDFDELSKINLDLHKKNWRKIMLPKGFVLHLPPGYKDAVSSRLKGKILPVASTTEFINQG